MIGKLSSLFLVFLFLIILFMVFVLLPVSAQSSPAQSSSVESSPAKASSFLSAPSNDLAPAASDPVAGAGPRTVEDDLGRAVTLERRPERLVSLSPSITEILFALGLGERVVGVTRYCNYPPEVEALKVKGELAQVGGFKEPDLEGIVALRPDLVLAGGIKSRHLPGMEAAGLSVYVADPEGVAGIMDSIRRVGEITLREGEAEALASGIEERMEEVARRAAGLERRRVVYVVWHDPLKVAGSGTFEDELVEMAGGDNVFGDVQGYAPVDVEAVLARDPQVIIACTGMGDGGMDTLDWALEAEALAQTEARQTGRVHGLKGDVVTRPGPRIAEALEVFARTIHPEAF